MKVKKKNFLAAGLLALSFISLGVSVLNVETKSASALTKVTAKYLTNGTTNDGDTTKTGCPSNFKIYMYGNTLSGNDKTLPQNTVTNWSNYTFYIDAVEIDHKSFKLYRNGSIYVSKTLSGSGDMTMYSAALPSGDYELQYVGEDVGFLWITTKYTYKFKFTVDVTPPTYTLEAGGKPIYNNSYTNQQVVYTAADNRSVLWICCLRPGYSSYTYSYSTSYTVNTSSPNGWYYIYSEDTTSNCSDTVYFYLDTVVPKGKVTNSTGITIANGGYTNSSIKYTATDTGCGVSGYQYKAPGDTTWSSYTAGSSKSGTGWHTFRAYDKAGNYTEEYKVYYDSVAPSDALYGGTVSYASGGYTNAEYVKYVANDGASGLANCYVKMPNSTYYTNYASGTQLATEGLYHFYAVDKSGNSTETKKIVLDKTKPTGTLYAGNSSVSSGAATNANYITFTAYDFYGIKYIYVKKPNANSYIICSSMSQFSMEGTYQFYAVDLAGNISDIYTVTLDRKIPTAQLYVDDKQFHNNSYTNGAHIRFECEAKNCFVKKPGEDSFSTYVLGMEFYKPGKYVFYGETESGTRTDYYSIVIDRTISPLIAHNIKNGITTGNAMYDWKNGDAEISAPIISVTINGKPYSKKQPIYTIDTGSYEVVATDAAGNVWTTSFVSTKMNVLTKTLQKEYYETHDANGNYYTFSSYDNAFDFAVLREKTYVKTGEWRNTTWDTGLAMDAKDSVNARNGTYFIYKKSGVPGEEVAYFTQERLEEVIAEYANTNLNRYYYWEKMYAPIADGENLFSYSDARVILANKIELCENVGCLVDGVEFIGNAYEGEGKHVLTIFDEWGNTCEYNVIVVRSTANIRYTVGEGLSNLVSYDRVYRFKDPINVFITDENDEFAMFRIFTADGELLGNYHLGDTVEISESGSYTVIAVNHYGQSQEFQLIISRYPPEVFFEEDTEKKRLDLIIGESKDNISTVQTLEIYKSIDGGETWVLLNKDDYGTFISTQTSQYSFRTSGDYRVVICDEFRTGFDAIELETKYKQLSPVGVLTGVKENGYTNGIVTFAWTDEAIVLLSRDGEILNYESGMQLTEDGAYVLVFENYDGYQQIYEFVIDTKAPELLMEGVKMQGKTQTNVKVHYTETEFKAKLIKDGVEVGEYESGTEITETGAYKVKISDYANNSQEVSFEIDKIVAYNADVNDKGLANSVTITATEEVFIMLAKDDTVLDYELGTELTAPGRYSVMIQDLLGNTDRFSFTIIEPKVNAFTHNFDDVPGFEMVVMNGSEKRLNYGTLELFEDGTYEVGVIANGKTYTFTITIDAVAPTLVLNGVVNGGTTKDSVTITDISEPSRVTVYLNDKEISYTHGNILKNGGNYKVVVTDECGNFTEYSFSIEKTMDNANLTLIVIGCIGALGVIVFVILKKKKIF